MVANIKLIEETAKELGVEVAPVVCCDQMTPGEMYLAHRNGPVKLLTCLKDDRENGWVLNKEGDYPYDTRECFRIVTPNVGRPW